MAKAVLNSWTVDALAEFLNSQDLRGPAATLQGAGVKGSDFAAWTYTLFEQLPASSGNALTTLDGMFLGFPGIYSWGFLGFPEVSWGFRALSHTWRAYRSVAKQGFWQI